MKRNLLIIAALLAILTMANLTANAQTPASTTSGNVPLKITLVDIVAITLGGSPDVEFLYDTQAKYGADQVVNKPTAFTVFSNKTYNIAVKANAAFNVVATNLTPVPLDVVAVSVNALTPVTNGTYAAPALSTTNQALVTGGKPTLATVYNIDYTISAAKAQLLLDKTAGVYTTTLMYTLTQQ